MKLFVALSLIASASAFAQEKCATLNGNYSFNGSAMSFSQTGCQKMIITEKGRALEFEVGQVKEDGPVIFSLEITASNIVLNIQNKDASKKVTTAKQLKAASGRMILTPGANQSLAGKMEWFDESLNKIDEMDFTPTRLD